VRDPSTSFSCPEDGPRTSAQEDMPFCFTKKEGLTCEGDVYNDNRRGRIHYLAHAGKQGTCIPAGDRSS